MCQAAANVFLTVGFCKPAVNPKAIDRGYLSLLRLFEKGSNK